MEGRAQRILWTQAREARRWISGDILRMVSGVAGRMLRNRWSSQLALNLGYTCAVENPLDFGG